MKITVNLYLLMLEMLKFCSNRKRNQKFEYLKCLFQLLPKPFSQNAKSKRILFSICLRIFQVKVCNFEPDKKYLPNYLPFVQFLTFLL